MALDFDTLKLDWRATDAQSKAITISNTGTTDLWVQWAGAATSAQPGDEFFWGAQPRTQLGRRRPNGWAPAIRVPVRPPRLGAGARTATVTVIVTDAGGNEVQRVAIPCRNDATARVNFGDMAVTRIDFDPPGNDLTNEGEFVELTNLTTRTLDLNGCTLWQRTFSSSRAPNQPTSGSPQALWTFRPATSRLDFGRDNLLPPGATLRVLTRGPRTGEDPGSVPDFGLRLYLGLNNPVWNNGGDRASVTNEFPNDNLVCSFGYGSQALTGPNAPAPAAPATPPVVVPPGQLRTVFSATALPILAFNEGFPGIFEVEDGDVVTISTNEAGLINSWLTSAGTPAGTIKLDPLGPLILPSGLRLAAFGVTWIDPAVMSPEEPQGSWPIQNAPQGGLIAQIDGRQPMFVGAGTSFTLVQDRRRTLRLGINDAFGGYWNNSGVFLVNLTVRRR